jgi:hypothetical protein
MSAPAGMGRRANTPRPLPGEWRISKALVLLSTVESFIITLLDALSRHMYTAVISIVRGLHQDGKLR